MPGKDTVHYYGFILAGQCPPGRCWQHTVDGTSHGPPPPPVCRQAVVLTLMDVFLNSSSSTESYRWPRTNTRSEHRFSATAFPQTVPQSFLPLSSRFLLVRHTCFVFLNAALLFPVLISSPQCCWKHHALHCSPIAFVYLWCLKLGFHRV